MKKVFLIIVLFLSFTKLAYSDSTDYKVENEEKNSIFQSIENWYDENMNYYTITLLMTVESSFIPFPSEIVIPPAAFVASKEDSNLNIYLVVLFGTIGALLGAWINYFLALFLGRPILHSLAGGKVGKFLFLSSEKIQKAEDYFQKHGNISTLVGRLIPVIRQLISLPAGLARMNFISFSILTFIGAGIWNTILAFLGYLAQGQSDLIYKYSHEIGYVILFVVLVVGLFYLIKFRRKKK